jgi:hypothetical protein
MLQPTIALYTTGTMYKTLALASLSLFGAATAQQVGKETVRFRTWSWIANKTNKSPF